MDRAQEQCEKSRSGLEKTLGKEHSSYASTLNNMGFVLEAKGDLDGAVALYEECRAIEFDEFLDMQKS